MKYGESDFFAFIRRYPRICTAAALVVFAFFFALPYPVGAKFRMLVQTVVLGLLIALGVRLWQKQKR